MSQPLPQILHLPNTLEHWPWQRQINPYYEEVRAESLAWIHSFKPFNARSQYAFDKGDFTLIAALCYPEVTRASLLAGSNLMNMFFVIDEYTDVELAPVARYMVNVVMDAMKNPEKLRPDGEIVLGKIAQSFWLSSFHSASTSTQRHFLNTFADYLDSVVEQAAHRELGRYCGIEEYMQKRRNNIGALPSFVILELDLKLTEEVYSHPLIVELRTFATDMIIIDNDIVSYNKEQATGDDHYNLVTLAMRSLKTDFDGAIAYCVRLHDERKQTFMEGVLRLPHAGFEEDKEVNKYIRGLANWPRGNDCWNFECGRYFGKKGSEYQKERRVPLLAKVVGYRSQELHADRVVVPLVDELRDFAGNAL